MCGICGVVALEGRLDPAVRSSIDAMTASLQHRGPDGQGVMSDASAALGHRRLAIIDRATGAQPMTNEDGSCWVVFNGEIYNHHGLRQRLEQRGHVFTTKSDTECIVHAYEEFGTSCVDHFEGMFAFAVYDSRRREVFIARDRLGKKPLFYATFGRALHFGSEIKALRASPHWDAEIDLSQLEAYLSLGYVLAPATMYRHVRKLPAGHWLRASRFGIEVQRYWDVERFDDYQGSDSELSNEIDETIRTAVRDRLESEVPLGAFLSGGIDSGLVVSYMAETLGPGVITTSVGFGTADDELDAAQLTATRFQTEHHVEVVQPDPASVIDRIVDGFDEPFADASAVPTFHVAGMAKRRVTVVLSGDGGDEAFGGYGFRYAPHAVESMARAWLPGRPGRAAAAWLGERWPRPLWMPKPLRWGTLLENIARDPAAAYFSDLCLVKPHVARGILGLPAHRDPSTSDVYEAVTEPYRRCSSLSAVQRAQYADLKIYLANDVLVKVDRMTMQHGVEVRAPLLDRRVIELAFRIPTARKMPRLQSKYLLRQLARRRLPSELVSLPKHGFHAPMREWLAGPCAARFRDDVLAPGAAVRGLVDVPRVRGLFDDHAAGRADYGQALWSVWMLARWSGREREQARPECQLVEARS
jgi:asparagine synthase (glutamine-hydrolysing)